jgi:type VI secretion system protein ImpA
MAATEFASIVAAISDAEPCGPDLDLAGDAEYMNILTRAEGLLPATFFSGPGGKPFDRSSIDFDTELAAIAPLLARSRDLRLLTVMTKLLCLNRDLAGIAGALGAISALLDQRWDDVHPRAEDGDFSLRMATLASLDDLPTVVIPLQHVPLASHQRTGAVTYRGWAIARGDAKARDGEDAPDLSAVNQTLAEVELSRLVETRGHFVTIQSALAGLSRTCAERADAWQTVRLESLSGQVTKILKLLDGAVIARDPSLAIGAAPATGAADGDSLPDRTLVEGSQAGVATPSGAITCGADAIDALDSVASYLSRNEPSSPALLLVRQAQQLTGKSFLEVMQTLVPSHVEKATIQIGRDRTFRLPVNRLATFGTGADAVAADESAVSRPSAERPQLTTRQEANRLLDQIGIYYRLAEPSSPVPFLAERARSLSERDFLSLLGDLLPDASFKDGTLT